MSLNTRFSVTVYVLLMKIFFWMTPIMWTRSSQKSPFNIQELIKIIQKNCRRWGTGSWYEYWHKKLRKSDRNLCWRSSLCSCIILIYSLQFLKSKKEVQAFLVGIVYEAIRIFLQFILLSLLWGSLWCTREAWTSFVDLKLVINQRAG